MHFVHSLSSERKWRRQTHDMCSCFYFFSVALKDSRMYFATPSKIICMQREMFFCNHRCHFTEVSADAWTDVVNKQITSLKHRTGGLVFSGFFFKLSCLQEGHAFWEHSEQNAVRCGKLRVRDSNEIGHRTGHATPTFYCQRLCLIVQYRKLCWAENKGSILHSQGFSNKEPCLGSRVGVCLYGGHSSVRTQRDQLKTTSVNPKAFNAFIHLLLSSDGLVFRLHFRKPCCSLELFF